MSKYLHKIRDMLCDELDEIAEKGELTAGNLEAVDKLTHSIKSIDTILAMQDAGYSERGYSYNYPRYHDYHDGDYSEARGRTRARRDEMGRYSRADEHEHMVMELREAMAKDSAVREDIKRLIDKVERM